MRKNINFDINIMLVFGEIMTVNFSPRIYQKGHTKIIHIAAFDYIDNSEIFFHYIM